MDHTAHIQAAEDLDKHISGLFNDESADKSEINQALHDQLGEEFRLSATSLRNLHNDGDSLNGRGSLPKKNIFQG